MSLNDKAFVPALGVVLPKAVPLIKKAVIPDISDSSSYYSLEVTNLYVSEVNGLNTDNIKLSFSDNLVKVDVKGVEIGVEGDAHIKALFISADGTLTVKVNDIQANVALTSALNGDRLSFSAAQLSVDTGKIDVSISGNIGAEILNLFTSYIEETVKSQIVSAAQKAIEQTLIPKLNAFASQVAYDYELSPSPFSVHVNPAMNPSEQNGVLSAGVIGYLYNTVIGGTPEVKAPVPFDITSSSSFLQVQISDYSLNSALWAIHVGKSSLALNQALLDQAGIPDLDGIMNTDRFEKIFPGFVEAFGADRPVQLVLSTISQGNVHASAQGLEATQFAKADIQIMDSTGNYV